MTREEAIQYAEDKFRKGLYRLDLGYLNRGLYQIVAREVDFMRAAIAALREQEHKRYTAHDVACIIAELFGDDCACNFNGIDEWLPQKCELLDACPNTVGVACWEQYLKHKEDT